MQQKYIYRLINFSFEQLLCNSVVFLTDEINKPFKIFKIEYLQKNIAIHL